MSVLRIEPNAINSGASYTFGNVSVTGNIAITGNIVPTSNNIANLGDPTHRFGSLYLAGNTIDLGGAQITNSDGNISITSFGGNVSFDANVVNFLSNVSQGAAGYTGSQGDQGYAGSRGYNGSIGSSGYTGSTGSLGYSGSKGDAGVNGFNGSRGDTGYVGSTGIFESNTAPANTSILWLDTTASGGTGYTGSAGSAGYTGSGSGVSAYTSLGSFPGSGNTAGQFAFANDTKTLYVWNGTQWLQVYAGPNQMPLWNSTINSSYQLSPVGNTTVITATASDPDGFPITYSYATSPSNQTQANIVNSGNGSFILTPSTTSSDAGSFVFRIKASDGIQVAAQTATITLAFGIPNVTGIRFVQVTSAGSYGNEHMAFGVLNGQTVNIFDNATIRGETTVTAGAWGSGVHATAKSTGYYANYFIDRAANYNVTLPDPFYTPYCATPGNPSIDVKWTTPLLLRQIFISGDATNGYDYWYTGYAQLWINGVLDTTQYSMVGSVNSEYNFVA